MFNSKVQLYGQNIKAKGEFFHVSLGVAKDITYKPR